MLKRKKFDMEDYSFDEMYKFMTQFISELHDYLPKCGIEEERVVGCFNTCYHNDIGKSLVYPPIKKGSEVSFATVTTVYVLTNDGEIYVLDNNLNVYNLKYCLGDSVKYVFVQLREAYSFKVEDDMKKGGH